MPTGTNPSRTITSIFYAIDALQPPKNRLLEEDTLPSTGVMPDGFNYDPKVQYGISANSYVWPKNIFTDQIFPLLDTSAADLQPSRDQIGKPS